MKKIFNNILIAGCICLGVASCSPSFLDTESKTESDTGTFYKTEQDAYRALIGCYDGWRQTSSAMAIGFYLTSEVMAPECLGATGFADDRKYQVVDRFDPGQESAAGDILETDWKNYYAAVYRCNELISRKDQIQWKDGDSKYGTYIGEARGIRALLYFDMTRLWGEVPVFTEPVNENRPRASVEEVFNVIFEDLKFAIDSIPATAYPKAQAATNDGHFTKYAAEALFARAYLYYTGRYGEEHPLATKEQALAAVEDIIASTEFALIPQYKNLWPASSAAVAEKGDYVTLNGTYAGDGNKEVIFAQKYTPTQDYNGNNDSNRWQVMVGMRSLNAAPYGKGWGAMTVVPSFYESYPAGDTRRDASIINLETEGITADDEWEKSMLDTREYTGYVVKKYSPLCYADGSFAGKQDGSGDFQTNNAQDYVIVRYADVLLMAAELGSPNAQSYFDQVRKRAYALDDNGTLAGGYSPKSVSLDAIMEERRLEFAFESVNYWDILRQGIDYAAAELALELDVLSGGATDHVSISAERVKATNGLCQVPKNQITLSGNVLTQNEGWK